jgi:hypothetical protein
MTVFAKVRVNGLDTHTISPGDTIGRLWRATLSIPDPRLGKVHGVFNLRESVLLFSSLRVPFRAGGQQLTEVVLRSGLEIELSPDTSLEILELSPRPPSLALDLPEGRRRLTAAASIKSTSRIELEPGVASDAALVIWSDGRSWFARRPSEQPFELVPGTSLQVGGTEIPVVIGAEGDRPTSPGPESAASPLHLFVRYETVHIHRELRKTLVIDGLGARIISELAIAGVPVGWQVIAGELWKDEADLGLLRRKWDAVIVRVRRKLRLSGIRPDLIRADRHGNFELFLEQGDRLDDQT